MFSNIIKNIYLPVFFSSTFQFSAGPRSGDAFYRRAEQLLVLTRLNASVGRFYADRSPQQLANWRRTVERVPQHTGLVFRYYLFVYVLTRLITFKRLNRNFANIIMIAIAFTIWIKFLISRVCLLICFITDGCNKRWQSRTSGVCVKCCSPCRALWRIFLGFGSGITIFPPLFKQQIIHQ
jgi:hypothetical protein